MQSTLSVLTQHCSTADSFWGPSLPECNNKYTFFGPSPLREHVLKLCCSSHTMYAWSFSKLPQRACLITWPITNHLSLITSTTHHYSCFSQIHGPARSCWCSLSPCKWPCMSLQLSVMYPECKAWSEHLDDAGAMTSKFIADTSLRI